MSDMWVGQLRREVGDLADDVQDQPTAAAGARLRIGVVDAITAAGGSNRATVTIDGLPCTYDASYTPTVNDVVWWLEDQQVRVVGGKLV